MYKEMLFGGDMRVRIVDTKTMESVKAGSVEIAPALTQKLEVGRSKRRKIQENMWEKMQDNMQERTKQTVWEEMQEKV